MSPHIVELTKRGKLVTGEPYFTPGTPVTIDRKGLGEAQVGDLVSVTQGRGRARVERLVGSAKVIENVLEALLVEEGLRRPFEPHDLPEPSFEDRVDLRELFTFTIDPETAKDFDDGISVRAEGDGLRVWVHIADVSYFVPAGSPLDRGAAERANSVYVPGLVAPMLPPALADDACSLRPNQDRLTVTVEVPFSADLEAGSPRSTAPSSAVANGSPTRARRQSSRAASEPKQSWPTRSGSQTGSHPTCAAGASYAAPCESRARRSRSPSTAAGGSGGPGSSRSRRRTR